MRKESAAVEIFIFYMCRQSWPEDSWALCSLTLWDPSSALVFIRKGRSGSHRAEVRMLFFGYIIENMLFLKKGRRLRMQQEVEGSDDLGLSQLPNGYRQKSVKIYGRVLSQDRNWETLW